MKFFKQIILIFVGLVFIASAVLKFLSIESFENYIYSFGLFGFGLCNIAARLLVAFEAILGLCLCFGLFSRKIWWISVAVLSVFSVFLLVQVVGGETENCHCFGEAIELSPLQSLLKNIVMLVLLAFAFPKKTTKPVFKHEKWLAAGFAVVALVATLAVSPPDIFFRIETSAKGVNKELLQKIKTGNNIEKDKKMLCFFGTFCKYCKLSANRIAAFSKNGQIPPSDIHFVFVGDTASVKQFMQKTGTEKIDFSFLPPEEFLEFTEGKMPTIILQNNDSVVGKLSYRSLTEKNLEIISPK